MLNHCLRLLFASLTAILAAAFMTVAHAGPLQVDLEAVDSNDKIRISLTNSGAVPLTILRWDTPFESTLSSNVFRIERPTKQWPLSEAADYVGREVKRADPNSSHFLLLQPGATVSTQLVLNEYYEIEATGSYSVNFDGDFHYTETLAPSDVDLQNRKVEFLNELASVNIQSGRVIINLSPKPINLPRPTARVVPSDYQNCSVEQQTAIDAAAVVAEQMVTTATFDLSGLTDEERVTSPRYNTWFGSYAETRFNQVLSQYQAIGEALATETIRFDCGCDEDQVYAYVYPSRPYNVFLCPAFDRANIDGTDSRAGTIIHELSHFTVLGGTDDHAYGQFAVQALASSDPVRAVGNADSIEYFAENTPMLAIRNDGSQPNPQQFIQLELDTPVRGELALGETVVYEVLNASNIALESLSGDADITIYSDEALSAEICSSSSSSALDVCEIFQSGRIFIQVLGYSASTFTLEATGDSTSVEPVIDAIVLALESPVAGSLLQGERAIYEVEGANLIELESYSGDADLYVFNSLDFDSSNIICSSVLVPPEFPTDSCNVPDDVSRIYVLVVGYTASEFSLVARVVTPSDGYVFSRTDTTEFRWVIGNNNIWITSDCAASLGGATASGTWSDLNAVAPGFDQAASPCNGIIPPDTGVGTPPITADGYVFSRSDTTEFRWVIGNNNIWITSDCAASLGGATESGTWSDLNAIAPGFDQAASPCNGISPDNGDISIPSDGFVFARDDKNEFRWVVGSNNIWIPESCAITLGGASLVGSWSDLNALAPGFDQAENPCPN